MPTVPRYGTPQVEERGLPGVRVNTEAPTEAFGGGKAAQNLTAATINAFGAFADAKDDVDQSVAKEAYYRAKLKRNTLTYGDAEAKKAGYLSSSGKDAVLSTDKYKEEFLKYGDDLENELSNDSQKAYFRSLFQTEAAGFDEDLKKHSFTEGKKFQSATSIALTQSYVEDAITNFKDIGRIQKSMLDQEGEIMASGKREGLPTELIDMQIKESHSKTHLGVTRRYMNTGDDMVAKNYFEANKDDMLAEHRSVLEKELETSTLKGQSQRESDAIFKKYPDNMTAAIEEAKKISDPDLRDETVRRVKDNFSTQKESERMDIEDLHRRSTDIIDRTGSVDNIPPQDWSKFSLSERSALQSYAKNRKEGIQPTTDWNEYYNLKSLASVPATKDKFLKMNLMVYRPRMADAEFKEIVNLQTGLRNGDEKAEKLLDGYRSDSMIVNDALDAAGYDISGKSKDSEQVNLFRKIVDDQIVLRQRQLGRKVTNDEIQQIVDKQLIKVRTDKGIFYDTKKRLFEVEPSETFDIEVDDVPKADRLKIESALKKNGMPVTDDNIILLYQRKHGIKSP